MEDMAISYVKKARDVLVETWPNNVTFPKGHNGELLLIGVAEYLAWLDRL